MNDRLIAACLQLHSTPDPIVNRNNLAPMLREARERGAEMILLPENSNFIIPDHAQLFATARPEAEDETLAFLKRQAEELGVWLLIGSLALVTSKAQDRLANRGFLIDPKGNIAARYNKIHMFDADLGNNLCYRESSRYFAGNQAVVAKTPWCKIGFTICYDVRFPHLYRALAKAGASIIAIPAAFVKATGQKHWHVLTRARAIENGCFVLAPNQCGEHAKGRESYGHSLIIAPDGSILAEAGDEPAIIMAELDLAQVADARCKLPCLQHDREFEEPL